MAMRGLPGLPVAQNQLALAAPHGISASTTLVPVASGTVTGARSMIAGASHSTGGAQVRRHAAPRYRAAGPADPPRAPAAPSPTGVSSTRLVRRTSEPDSTPAAVVQQNHADLVRIEIEGHAQQVALEADQFLGFDVRQPADARDALARHKSPRRIPASAGRSRELARDAIHRLQRVVEHRAVRVEMRRSFTATGDHQLRPAAPGRSFSSLRANPDSCPESSRFCARFRAVRCPRPLPARVRIAERTGAPRRFSSAAWISLSQLRRTAPLR